MSSRKAKKPSVFDRLGPPEEEPRSKHYKRKNKDKEASTDSRRGPSSSHGSRHASHPYNHTPDASTTPTEHSSDGKRSKAHNDAKTKSEGKTPHGGGKERKRSHSHLDETDLMPSTKKQTNDVVSPHERLPTLKESDRSVSKQKKMRSQLKEEKHPTKGKSTDTGLGESKQDGAPDPVPKAKRTRSDTDISSPSDTQNVDPPPAVNAETKAKEGSLSSGGGGPVQRTASAGAPEVDKVAELDQEIASNQQEPAIVKKRMEALLGPSSGKYIKVHRPAGVYADVGCSERFSGEVYHSIVNVVQDEIGLDTSTVLLPGTTGMEFAKVLREKQTESQPVYEPKLGAFTAIDDRRWRQKMAASSSQTSSDSKSPVGPRFNQDGYLRAVALMKLSQSKSTSTSTKILGPSVKLPRSK